MSSTYQPAVVSKVCPHCRGRVVFLLRKQWIRCLDCGDYFSNEHYNDLDPWSLDPEEINMAMNLWEGAPHRKSLAQKRLEHRERVLDGVIYLMKQYYVGPAPEIKYSTLVEQLHDLMVGFSRSQDDGLLHEFERVQGELHAECIDLKEELERVRIERGAFARRLNSYQKFVHQIVRNEEANAAFFRGRSKNYRAEFEKLKGPLEDGP